MILRRVSVRAGRAANSRSSSTFLRAVNVPSSSSRARHGVELDLGGIHAHVDAVELPAPAARRS